jgi:hypothetical protein
MPGVRDLQTFSRGGPDVGGRVRRVGGAEAEHVSGQDGRVEEMIEPKWTQPTGVDGKEKIEGDVGWGADR